MGVRLTSQEVYLGHAIELLGVTPGDFSGLAAVATISDPTGQRICRFTELLDRQLQGGVGGWPEDDEKAAEQLMERAFHRARGAILLGRLKESDKQRYYVPEAPSYASRSRDYMNRLVLGALENVIRLEPDTDTREPFDDIGMCLLEDLDPADLAYVLARLRRAGLVEYWGMGDRRGNRTLRATDEGLLEADKLAVETRAPGFLLEETIAKAERSVAKHKPVIVEKLREQSVRVAEARELSEHDVGEIAHSCEQIIQDYLDLDILWEGIAEDRPPKGSTRDRLRIILRARVPSETETELLEALETYVVGWFGRLEKFVHKHRHLPGESDRRHAKRCIIYTYLLLADLSELLGL